MAGNLKIWAMFALVFILCVGAVNADYIRDMFMVYVVNPVKVTDNDGTIGNLDGLDGAFITIDFAHHEIHEGSHWMITHTDYDVDANHTYVIFPSNESEEIHITFYVSNEIAGTWDFRENITTSANGTQLASINNKRGDPDDTLEFYTDAVLDDRGDHLAGAYVGAGRAGGSTERDREIILDNSVAYALIFETTAVNNIINMEIEYYKAGGD